MAEAKLTRDQLIELVGYLMRAEGTEEQQDEWWRLLDRNLLDRQWSDLIFWPNRRGYDGNVTAEQIVDIALSYKPIILGPATNQPES